MNHSLLLRSVFLSGSILFAGFAARVDAVEIAPVPPQANLRAASVQVRVALDHRDWTPSDLELRR